MLDIKDLYSIFQKAGKIEEYEKILKLIDNQFKLREEIEKLKKLVKYLEMKLSFQEDLDFRNNSYWRKSSGDGPFCSRCWDKNRELIRIIPIHINGNYADCPECKNHVNYTGREESGIVNRAVNFDPYM